MITRNAHKTQAFSVLAVAALTAGSGNALAQNYTKCEVQVLPTDTTMCLPTTNGTTENINLEKADPSHTVVVVSVPARNCRIKVGNIRGGISVAIDSSGSLKTTDPNNERLTSADVLLGKMAANAAGQTLSNASADFPRIGVVQYSGRAYTVATASDGSEVFSDTWNKKTDPVLCTDGDSVASKYPDAPAKDRWDTKDTAGNLISLCEYLRPVAGNVLGSAQSSQPGMLRHADFFNYSGKSPRGATDLTYIFEAVKRDTMLGSLQTNAKNAIVISDGLPNIPIKRPADECREKAYLKDELINTETSGPNVGKQFCYDRNFRYGRDIADKYLETHSDYQKINLYHALFVPVGKSFSDKDDLGAMYPDDFLIENSARTGNGKVKFKYVRSRQDLETYVESLFENFDEAALQRVEVTVNSNTTYNAVSPGEFNKDFTIKLINLQAGITNVVVVKAVYSDTTVTKTYNVTIGQGAVTQPYNCGTTDGTNKTVDGDSLTSTSPKGDGVKPFPKNGIQDRVYRNADPENTRARSDFEVTSAGNGNNAKAATDPGTLRIQGGTGNCGVVAGLAGELKTWALLPFVLAPFATLILRIFNRSRRTRKGK